MRLGKISYLTIVGGLAIGMVAMLAGAAPGIERGSSATDGIFGGYWYASWYYTIGSDWPNIQTCTRVTLDSCANYYPWGCTGGYITIMVHGGPRLPVYVQADHPCGGTPRCETFATGFKCE